MSALERALQGREDRVLGFKKKKEKKKVATGNMKGWYYTETVGDFGKPGGVYPMTPREMLEWAKPSFTFDPAWNPSQPIGERITGTATEGVMWHESSRPPASLTSSKLDFVVAVLEKKHGVNIRYEKMLRGDYVEFSLTDISKGYRFVRISGSVIHAIDISELLSQVEHRLGLGTNETSGTNEVNGTKSAAETWADKWAKENKAENKAENGTD